MSRASDKAYHWIRDRIVSREFASGERLKEEDISSRCGVSRTPIREAFRRLAAEYFVRLVPNHGAYVSEWSPKDVDEIFILRTMLEGYAADRAAQNISEEALKELTRCCTTVDAMIAKGGKFNVEIFLDLNNEFHRLIREAADSERLVMMLERLVEPRVVISTAMSYRMEEIQRSNDHHRQLVEALRARDGAWAKSVMEAHVHAAHRAFLRMSSHGEGGVV